MIEIEPDFYMGHRDLQQTYTGLGRTAEAEAVSRKVLELVPNYLLQNPDDARARMFYAITLLEVGRRDEATAAGVTNFGWMKHDPDFDPTGTDFRLLSACRARASRRGARR